MGTESASEGCGAPPLRARAAGKNAAFELLEAAFKASFVSDINLGVDLTRGILITCYTTAVSQV